MRSMPPDELGSCLAFIQTLDARCAEQTERFRYGVALRSPSLPRIYDLNLLFLDRGARPSLEELLADADAMLAPFAHRKVATHDDAAGSALAPDLVARGWAPKPLLVMPWRREARRPDPSTVAEVSFDRLEPAWRSGTRQAGFDDDLVEQVVGQRRVIGAAGSARYFAALVDGEVASYCELYSDGDVAQIEGVLTLERFRNRGLAAAVVTRARTAAQKAGHGLTFLVAEEDDWPKELYRKLGFETAGRTWDFLLEPRG
jgi:ribosomal protein S18 acetylase RimI-like enzyme